MFILCNINGVLIWKFADKGGSHGIDPVLKHQMALVNESPLYGAPSKCQFFRIHITSTGSRGREKSMGW